MFSPTEVLDCAMALMTCARFARDSSIFQAGGEEKSVRDGTGADPGDFVAEVVGCVGRNLLFEAVGGRRGSDAGDPIRGSGKDGFDCRGG